MTKSYLKIEFTVYKINFLLLITVNVLNRSKDLGSIYLGPIQPKPKYRIWYHYSQHTPSPRGECTEQTRPVQTSCNISSHVPANLSLVVTLPTIS